MKSSFSTGFGLLSVIVLVLASGTLGHTTHTASAGAIVDPSTLQPPPPNAVCRDDGRQIICDTFVDEVAVNEPITDFDLPAGRSTRRATTTAPGRAGTWIVWS